MDRDKTLILEYLLHNGDLYRNNAKAAIDKLRGSRYLTASDLEEIYKAVILDELFDKIQRDIYLLLRFSDDNCTK